MNKKAVAIALTMVALLMLGTYGMYIVYDNMFPYAAPMRQLEMNRIESIRTYDDADNKIALSDAELQTLISCVNAAEATRTMSVNDYPSVTPYYVVEIKTDERVFRYILYEQNGSTYVEIPYEGIYEIERDAIELMEE